MSRMERVKYALTSTVAKLRSDIETSHKNNKIPADYSLGFTNGLIFAEHHVLMRDGRPKFYDKTTSIGSLPKPVVLKPHSDIAGADQTYEWLRDAVILSARNLDKWDDTSLSKVREAIKKMDEFVEQMASLEEAGKDEVEGDSDANVGDHESSSLSPASTQAQ